MKDKDRLEQGYMHVTNALFDNTSSREARVDKIAQAIYDMRENRYFPEFLEKIDLDDYSVPAKRFRQHLSEEQLKILAKGMDEGLNKINKPSVERKVLGIISIGGFVVSLLFLSGITGNVIGVRNIKNLIGIIPFIVGLIAGTLFFWKRKKNR